MPKGLSGKTIASIPVSAGSPTRNRWYAQRDSEEPSLKDSLQRCRQGEGNLAGMRPRGLTLQRSCYNPLDLKSKRRELLLWERAALLPPPLGQTVGKPEGKAPRVTSLNSAHRGQPCSKWRKGRVDRGERTSEQRCSFCPSTTHSSFR